MKIAIYPGSFDPITNGHVDIIQRAVGLFDRVIVAVAASDRKQPCIPAQQRLAITKEVLSPLATVVVVPLRGLLVDIAQEYEARYVVKGLRNSADFEYEQQQAWMNDTMADTPLETICFFAASAQDKISSTMVREIASLGGDVNPFVPRQVSGHLAKGS
ncbi:MAG: pantetheine-phosphate adenylyltransferase [Coxiellaceae bacterium]|nr:pantetheine-phosphate adenylyltransferase [Coxiellaceae bacterium]